MNTSVSKPAARIAVIGAGAMGGAFASGVLAAASAVEVRVSNPGEAPLERLAALGAFVTHSNVEAASGADIVVVAVKPWIVPAVMEELKGVLDYGSQTLAVIAAGISGDDLMAMLDRDGKTPQTALVMPNTAMAVGESMTFVMPVNAGEAAVAAICSLFDLLGRTKVITERQWAGATSLASCGIAYAMRYVRAAVEGGVQLGFKAAEAQDIVAQTLRGACALLDRPGAHPESEIDKVTTPGGLTIRGLNEMERAGFTSAVIRGLLAST